MADLIDLSMMDPIAPIIGRNHQRIADIASEGFWRKLDHVEADVDAMARHVRSLIDVKADATEHLREAETTFRAALLVVLLLKRQAE